MKKADILVIALVFLISVTFYVIYFSMNNLGEDLIVEVSYRKQLIYAVKLEDDTDVKVKITSEGQILTVVIKDPSGTVIDTDLFSINEENPIENTVSITYDVVEMVHANCKNKYCYRMKIHHSVSSPIICTNGVIVKMAYNDWSNYEINL